MDGCGFAKCIFAFITFHKLLLREAAIVGKRLDKSIKINIPVSTAVKLLTFKHIFITFSLCFASGFCIIHTLSLFLSCFFFTLHFVRLMNILFVIVWVLWKSVVGNIPSWLWTRNYLSQSISIPQVTDNISILVVDTMNLLNKLSKIRLHQWRVEADAPVWNFQLWIHLVVIIYSH